MLGLVYATGWLLPIGLSLPGFSFFRGPGRYGIVTTLAIALLAGQMLSQFSVRNSSSFSRRLVFVLAFFSTCGDLWLVSRMVTYTYIISTPAIAYRDISEVRKLMLAEPRLSRILAPGPNVGNLLGVSCVPWYLGIRRPGSGNAAKGEAAFHWKTDSLLTGIARMVKPIRSDACFEL